MSKSSYDPNNYLETVKYVRCESAPQLVVRILYLEMLVYRTTPGVMSCGEPLDLPPKNFQSFSSVNAEVQEP